MATAFPFGVWIGPDPQTFDISYSYYIPAYIDPETGEVFDQTNWTAEVRDAATGAVVSFNWGTSFDYGDAYAYVGFDPAAEPGHFKVNFHAENWFSAAGQNSTVDVFSAGLSDTPAVLVGTAGVDIIAGGNADDVLSGGDGQDWIDGGTGDDVIAGGEGDDWLAGGLGTDTLVGGNGDDTYDLSYLPGDIVVEQFGGGRDLVITSFGHTLAENVEDLQLFGIAGIWGKGNNESNKIEGNAGANFLWGENGDDFLYGGGSDDTIRGGWGKDLLDGGTGSDVLIGNEGGDTYHISDVADRIREKDGATGVDTVKVFGLEKYRMDAFVENAERGSFMFDGSSAAIRLIGNALDNRIKGGTSGDTIKGGDGDDRIQGMGGDDTLEGGAGADQFVFQKTDGAEMVLDFAVGDLLVISAGAAFDSFEEVMAAATEVPGEGTTLALGTGLQIHLSGISMAALAAENFLFA